MNVSPKMYKAILTAPKGVVPASIKVAKAIAKSQTNRKTEVSTKKGNFGATYTKYGPVSILKSNATEETKKIAMSKKKAEKPTQPKRVPAYQQRINKSLPKY